ncbi:hypothetical protein GCM10028803_08280 [Larkinella knui]|uniref:DUF2721 domain-containing protein n=1 Tax=Larkinella knui TaxID=2025310 RepID=A0A3P1CJS4_9BACT|nr:hypothetical protein [Larkinella knui]RRB13509.1 hypothetical protein EHT87_14665 [Larkinella knui]
MNLDELKSTWKAYDEKILVSQKLSEQLVFLMIKDRSKGTLARMERNLKLAGFIMTAVVFFFTAAIAGNAFDYTSWYFYIPSVLYIVLALVALVIVIKNVRNLSHVDLSRQNLYDSLKTVLRWHEKAQAALSRVWLLCMLSGFLFGVSMVARNVEAYGTTKVILLLGGQTAVILLLYAAARWLFHAFEDTHGNELRESLQEMEQLKTGM